VGILLAALARKVMAAEFPHEWITFGVSLLLIWTGIALRW
jgi:hypothetical protein